MLKLIPAPGIVGVARLVEAASGEYRQIMELVQAALIVKLGLVPERAWLLNVEAMFADRVIVRRDGRFWSYGYTLSDDNKVTLADAQEVVENYVPVALREAFEQACFVEAAAGDGSAWDAVLIRAGRSKNNYYYSDAVLREAAPRFEGARSYAKSDAEHFKGSPPDVHQLAGWVSGVHFVEGAKKDTGHLAARYNFAVGAASLRDTVADAWRRGKRDLVGLSIDALGTAEKVMREGVKHAKAITKVSSVDLIVEPGAGGALVRLVEAADPEREQDMSLRQKMLDAIKAKKPAIFATIDPEAITDDDLATRYAEACQPEQQQQQQGDTAAGTPMTVEAFREAMALVELRTRARTIIGATNLPQPAKDKLVARFESLSRFAEADVTNEITAERDYLTRMAETFNPNAGRVQLPFEEGARAEDRSVKIADMLDAFFDPAHKNHRATQSFKECYIEVTGDKRVTGRWENVDRSRMAESVGAAFRESLDSTSWANVLGSAITRRLIADYRLANRYDVWRRVCNVVPVTDFRTQERTRYGGYGDLPTVGENDAYQSLSSPTDEKATYAIAKKGGTEDVSREMIKNDDVGAIIRIPTNLSRAAKRTLSKFVFDFVRTNPTLYDTVAFFHATHGNLGAAALDATSLAARRLAMLKQTEKDSAERLGIGPSRLVVPLDLEEGAVNLFNRNTNNDKTFVNMMTLEIIPVWYWTDTNDWALCADPVEVPGIEIAFLDGNEEPDLFVQDMPNVGSMFSNDKLTYKIRFEYGGNVVEYRGWDKSVV